MSLGLLRNYVDFNQMYTLTHTCRATSNKTQIFLPICRGPLNTMTGGFIYSFSQVFKCAEILLAVTNLWVFTVDTLYGKTFHSAGSTKPHEESCLPGFFKTSNKIDSAKNASE